MSNYQPAILDADWAPADERPSGCWYSPKEVVYSSGENCHSLARDALKVRCSLAREYRERKYEKQKVRSRKITAFVQRLLAGSFLALLWAVSLALLVGWTG